MVTKVFRNLKWIIEKLQNSRSMTFNEINDEWRKEVNLSKGVNMLRKTFYNYRKMLNDKFGIEIWEEENGSHAYYLKNPEMLRKDSLMKWMLNSLAIDEKFMGCKSLANRIVLENIPSGNKTLDCVTDAMMGNFKLRFNYMKYGSTEMNEYAGEPWALKLYHQRWYLLVNFGGDKQYTFGLDRMRNPTILAETFEMPIGFNAADYFEEFYGIYNSGREMTRIVLRAFGDENYYLRDLPIHKSQREIGSGDGYTDFMIELRPNKELIAYLLSRRERLKVLSPDSIVEEMKAGIDKMKANY